MRFVDLYRILVIAIAIAAWQISADLHLINPIFLSSPAGIVTTLVNIILNKSDVPSFSVEFWKTLEELLIAYVAVLAIGIPLGISIGWNKFIGESFEPLVIAFFSIPAIIIYPAMYLVLGLGMISKIALGVVSGLFVVIANSSAGMKSVKKELLVLSSSIGFSRFQKFSKIVLPSAFPTIATGLKLGLSQTFIGVIAAEIIIPNLGLGSLITTSFTLFRTDDLFALVAIVIAISTIGNVVLSYVEKRVNRYRSI